MNTLEIASTVLSMICLIITTVLAWLMLNKTTRTEVSFTGTPVDKKEFDRHQRENKEEHEKIFARIEATQSECKVGHEKLHFRINPIEASLSALRENSDTNTARLALMDAKIDRLIERSR